MMVSRLVRAAAGARSELNKWTTDQRVPVCASRWAGSLALIHPTLDGGLDDCLGLRHDLIAGNGRSGIGRAGLYALAEPGVIGLRLLYGGELRFDRRVHGMYRKETMPKGEGRSKLSLARGLRGELFKNSSLQC